MTDFLVTLQQALLTLSVFMSITVTLIYLTLKIPDAENFLASADKKLELRVIATLVLSLLIMLASEYPIVFAAEGARVNIRDSFALFAAIAVGPIEGIVVALAGGCYRMFLGGWTAVPCGLATICIGFIGAWLASYRGYRIEILTSRQVGKAAMLIGLWEIIHTLLYCPLLGTKPFMEGFSIMTTNFVVPMTAINVAAIAVFLLVCRDAVVRKRAKDALDEHARLLEARVAARTAELSSTNRLLSQENASRKRAEEALLRGREPLQLINRILRHDVTNHLSVIKSGLRLFAKTKDESLLAEASKRVDVSVDLIRRMRELESVIMEGEVLRPYDAKRAIEKVVKQYPALSFSLDLSCRTVMADDSLSSVITNIVENAVIHGRADHIDITLSGKGGLCELRISDNGSGMPQEIVEKVFEEGFIYGKTGRSGLGLYIVKKAAERYGGTVRIEGREASGTAVVFSLRSA